MKKIFLLILCLTLTACGATPPIVSSTTSLPNAIDPPGIVLTVDEIIYALDVTNQNNNFPLISDALKEETVLDYTDKTSLLCTKFTIQDGLAIYFLTDPTTSKVHQVSCEVNVLDLPPNDKVSTKMIVALCYLFEPSDYQKLGESLNLSSTESTVNTHVIKESREYYYRRSGTIGVLSILPAKQQLISISNISFEKAWTTDYYVKMLNEHLSDPELLKAYKNVTDEYEYTGREYQLGSSASLMLYKSIRTGLLDEVYLFVDGITAEETSVTNFASVATYTMMMFEPNKYDIVSSQVQLSEVTKNDRRLAHGDEWEYMYSVQNGRLSLMIVRRDSELFQRLIAPTEPSATPSSSQSSSQLDNRIPPKAIEDGE